VLVKGPEESGWSAWPCWPCWPCWSSRSLRALGSRGALRALGAGLVPGDRRGALRAGSAGVLQGEGVRSVVRRGGPAAVDHSRGIHRTCGNGGTHRRSSTCQEQACGC